MKQHQIDPDHRILLISPHSDDLALSVGGCLLATNWWANVPKTAVTVFVDSIHAPYSKIIGQQAITMLRKQEDRQFADECNLDLIQLPLGEAMTRGYSSVDSLFEYGDPRQDPHYERTGQLLADIIASRPWSAVIAPLGIGKHIEHVMVRMLCQDLNIKPLLLYEDLPYAADYDNDTLDFMGSFDGQLRLAIALDFTDLQVEKIRQLCIYASQISEREINQLTKYSKFRCIHKDLQLLRRAKGSQSLSHEVIWATPNDWKIYQQNLDLPRIW
ncbi:hypothetical protein [Nostoc sp.]|uniref:hypothetical protein n=1 Tax=Nostoc sp. TaxID=1180 RepID=UPI002FFAF288